MHSGDGVAAAGVRRGQHVGRDLADAAALVAAFQNVPPSLPESRRHRGAGIHAHPDAMRALVDALDEATLGTQILLTTHSAEMLDNPTIRPENLRVVQIIDSQTVIGPVDEASVEIVRRNLDTLAGLERQNENPTSMIRSGTAVCLRPRG